MSRDDVRRVATSSNSHHGWSTSSSSQSGNIYMIDTEEIADSDVVLDDDLADLQDAEYLRGQALRFHLCYLFDRMDSQWLRRQERRKTRLLTHAKMVIGIFVLCMAFASITDRLSLPSPISTFSSLFSLAMSEVPTDAQSHSYLDFSRLNPSK